MEAAEGDPCKTGLEMSSVVMVSWMLHSVCVVELPAGVANTAVRLRPEARALRRDVPVQVGLRSGICRNTCKI